MTLQTPTLAEELKREADLLQRRFVHHTRPKGPFTLEQAQGRCETTLTERFENRACQCGTYEGNLGPCKTFLLGADPGRCVYCDHKVECHQTLNDGEALDSK